MKITRGCFIFALLFVAYYSTTTHADVSCDIVSGTDPHIWDCNESVRQGLISYGWAIDPAFLGGFTPKPNIPGTTFNYNWDRLMVCAPIEPMTMAGVELTQRIDGFVKVTRQIGVSTGPLAQNTTAATINCGEEPPMLAGCTITANDCIMGGPHDIEQVVTSQAPGGHTFTSSALVKSTNVGHFKRSRAP